MNKRGFLSLLLQGAVVSTVAPSIFIPKLIEVPRMHRSLDIDLYHQLPFYRVKTVVCNMNAFETPQKLLHNAVQLWNRQEKESK